jgi:hypothetical protein
VYFVVQNFKTLGSVKLFQGTRFGLLADRSISAPVAPAKPLKKFYTHRSFEVL